MLDDSQLGSAHFVNERGTKTDLFSLIIFSCLRCFDFGDREESNSYCLGNFSRSLANTSSAGIAVISPRSYASMRRSASSAHSCWFLSFGGSRLSRSCSASRARVSTGSVSSCCRMSSLLVANCLSFSQKVITIQFLNGFPVFNMCAIRSCVLRVPMSDRNASRSRSSRYCSLTRVEWFKSPPVKIRASFSPINAS